MNVENVLKATIYYILFIVMVIANRDLIGVIYLLISTNYHLNINSNTFYVEGHVPLH